MGGSIQYHLGLASTPFGVQSGVSSFNPPPFPKLLLYFYLIHLFKYVLGGRTGGVFGGGEASGCSRHGPLCEDTVA